MIPIYNKRTGIVALRSFDQGVMDTLGAEADPNNFIIINGQKVKDPCYKLDVGGEKIPIYFGDPEQIFQNKTFPAIVIKRDDFSLNMTRWMGLGQLEYKYGIPQSVLTIVPSPYGYTALSGQVTGIPNSVSGYGEYERKPQAFPYDFIYTISCWDRYESGAQKLVDKILRTFNPLGRFIVYDSLSLMRSYEYYQEGSVVSLSEIIDPVTRYRGYAVTIRVEGELDMFDPYSSNTITGVELRQNVLKD